MEIKIVKKSVKGKMIVYADPIEDTEEAGRQSLKNAFNMYRMKYNLLYPTLIKEIRESLDMSQLQLAQDCLMPCTEINWIEKGGVLHDKKTDKRIRKAFKRHMKYLKVNNEK